MTILGNPVNAPQSLSWTHHGGYNSDNNSPFLSQIWKPQTGHFLKLEKKKKTFLISTKRRKKTQWRKKTQTPLCRRLGWHECCCRQGRARHQGRLDLDDTPSIPADMQGSHQTKGISISTKPNMELLCEGCKCWRCWSDLVRHRGWRWGRREIKRRVFKGKNWEEKEKFSHGFRI